MGWDNPPVPWREFERRLSWRQRDKNAAAGDDPGATDDAIAIGEDANDDGGGSVTRLPVASSGAAGTGQPRAGAGQKSVPWAELHCHSSYSFLDGASSPADLIKEAARCGLTAIAITDHDGMYGVPQFAQSAVRFKASDAGLGSDIATVFGAELSLDIPAASGPTANTARLEGDGPGDGWLAGAGA